MKHLLMLFIFFSITVSAYGFEGYVKKFDLNINVKKVFAINKGNIILFGNEIKEEKDIIYVKQREGLFNTKVVPKVMSTGNFFYRPIALEFDRRGNLINTKMLYGDENLLGSSDSSKNYYFETALKDENNKFLILLSENKTISSSLNNFKDIGESIANTMYKKQICLKIDSNLNKIYEKPLNFFSINNTKFLLTSSNNNYIEILGVENSLLFIKLKNNCNFLIKKPKGIDFDKNNTFILKATLTSNDNNIIVLGLLNHRLYILKIDNNLTKLFWEKKFKQIVGNSIIKTVDGYIIVGKIYKDNKEADALILKIDKNGKVIWQKSYGGKKFDEFKNIAITSDNGYIISGTTKSFGKGRKDIWIVKINNSGKISWDRTFGGKGNDWEVDMTKTTDGGFIVIGKSNSLKTNKNSIYLIKIDKNGNF